jgi:hypothetical protein
MELLNNTLKLLTMNVVKIGVVEGGGMQSLAIMTGLLLIPNQHLSIVTLGLVAMLMMVAEI